MLPHFCLVVHWSWKLCRMLGCWQPTLGVSCLCPGQLVWFSLWVTAIAELSLAFCPFSSLFCCFWLPPCCSFLAVCLSHSRLLVVLAPVLSLHEAVLLLTSSYWLLRLSGLCLLPASRSISRCCPLSLAIQILFCTSSGTWAASSPLSCMSSMYHWPCCGCSRSPGTFWLCSVGRSTWMSPYCCSLVLQILKILVCLLLQTVSLGHNYF